MYSALTNQATLLVLIRFGFSQNDPHDWLKNKNNVVEAEEKQILTNVEP